MREKNGRYTRNYALCVLCDKDDISFARRNQPQIARWGCHALNSPQHQLSLSFDR